MKRQTIAMVLVLLFVFCLPTISTAVDIDAYIHWAAPTAHADGVYIDRTISWDAVEGAEGYEVYLRRIEDGRLFLSGKIVLTNLHIIRFKTSGMYVYYTRSFKTIDGVKQYSEFVNSLDATSSIVIVDSEIKQRAWVVYVPFIK